MKLTRNEPELRERLHGAVDSMSLFEIIVLLFLVQYIRVSGVIKSLPLPRKALPEPQGPLFDKNGRITNSVPLFSQRVLGMPEPEQRGSYTYYDESVEFTQEDVERLQKLADRMINDVMQNTDRGVFGGISTFPPSPQEGYRNEMNIYHWSDPRSEMPYYSEPARAIWLDGPMGYCTPSRMTVTGISPMPVISGEWARDEYGTPIYGFASEIAEQRPE